MASVFSWGERGDSPRLGWGDRTAGWPGDPSVWGEREPAPRHHLDEGRGAPPH